MSLSFPGKIFVVVVIICSTFLYSRYQKNKYIDLSVQNAAPILTKLPDLALLEISTDKLLSTRDLIGKTSGVFAHLWGTWCAPCEAEMPEFLKFADKLKEKNITFLLIAVSDEKKKIKKFMRRFGKLSPHIKVVLDVEGKAMDQFGLGRVPETFLFEGMTGTFTKRFVGPQNWEMESYLHQALSSLSLN
ncbi:MAG: TlpA family protein disulfide reductase [Deltaproteobacteria bacterium]|nr:MAG: TlpA family protein disulfide reductase [Deltaproteobacteria bacterium]